MTKPDNRAMAALWMKRGEASDLIASIKRDAKDPRNSETAKAEALIAELSGCIDARDFSGAIPIINQLDRQLFKLRALEVVPAIKLGQYLSPDFQRGRNEANDARHNQAQAEWRAWQSVANEYWARHPSASKGEAAAFVIRKLDLACNPKTVARRLKKVGQAS